MSLEAILAAIAATGEAEAERIRAEAESRVQQIRGEAEPSAARVREEARRAALRSVAGERARRLHQAKLEALQIVGEVRDRFVDVVLAETRQRLADLRADPNYPLILQQLVEEAVAALGEEEMTGSKPVLDVDPRDEALLRRTLADLGLDLPVAPTLNSWGGVVVRGGDGRVVVTNTLEARFTRATSFLRRDLAACLEKEIKNSREQGELSAVS